MKLERVPVTYLQVISVCFKNVLQFDESVVLAKKKTEID